MVLARFGSRLSKTQNQKMFEICTRHCVQYEILQACESCSSLRYYKILGQVHNQVKRNSSRTCQLYSSQILELKGQNSKINALYFQISIELENLQANALCLSPRSYRNLDSIHIVAQR